MITLISVFGLFWIFPGESGPSQVTAKHGAQKSVLPPEAEV